VTIGPTPLPRHDALVSLDAEAAQDPERVGNKAATLAVLHGLGFPVPPGVVVTTGTFGRDDPGPALTEALAALPAVVGRGPYAVRSSGVAEDGPEQSFAGQFLTLLDVGPADLREAVRQVWASRASRHATAYRGDAEIEDMAVLIQPMVRADVAGVAFSVDPVTGAHRTIVEAVAGLGEGLVSGAQTPERWTADADGTMSGPARPLHLDENAARSVAELCRRVASALGGPQDIEWAISGGEVILLQARPVTATGRRAGESIPIPIEVPPGAWQRDEFHEMTAPISEFGLLMGQEQVIRSFRRVFAELGIMIDRAEARRIGGWLYTRMVPVGAPDAKPGRTAPRPPPRWLLFLILRLHPEARRRARAARATLAERRPEAVIRQWNTEWAPAHRRETDRALELDLRLLDDDELVEELDRRIEYIGHPAHVAVAMAYIVALYELTLSCRDLLDWDTRQTLSLLEGLSTTSTAPGFAIAGLATQAEASPNVMVLLDAIDASTPARLADADPSFAAAFEEHLREFGHRLLRYDVVESTLAETPHLLLALVAEQVRSDFSAEDARRAADERRNAAVARARAALSARSPMERERFESALARASEAYPAWEERTLLTFNVQGALFRYLALEIAGRLVDREQLDAVEDVFMLDPRDARAALLDGSDRRAHVRIVRAGRAWAQAHPGPMSYGPPPEDPPFDLLPPAARFLNEAVFWAVGPDGAFWGRGRASHDGAALVVGSPASAGRYTGVVRVITDEHELGLVRTGEVLVCPVTWPAWSVVFPSIGALVTDVGGVLSHPAIIAREFGIPAVVGTQDATTRLRNGQRVTVDGSRGVVEAAP
jgi:pyruvate,water dikinase